MGAKRYKKCSCLRETTGINLTWEENIPQLKQGSRTWVDVLIDSGENLEVVWLREKQKNMGLLEQL